MSLLSCWTAPLAAQLDATTTETPEEESPLTEPVATSAAVVRDLDVAPLNFCALGPDGKRTDAFQRQRVVMLDVAEDPSFQGAPEVELVKQGDKTIEVPRGVVRSIRPFEHAREVFLSVFPMKRLYLVLATETPDATFDDKQPIAIAAAQQLLASDPHVVHSLGCTDWLIAPYLKRAKVTWSKVEREKTVVDANGKSHTVKYLAWQVSVPTTARFEVYRRKGDQLVHHATLLSERKGTAAKDSLEWSNPASVYETISVQMPTGCMTDGVAPAPAPTEDAFQGCGGKRLDRISPAGLTPTLGTLVQDSHYCQNLSDEVTSDGANMPKLALCDLRTSAQYTAVDMQNEAKQMCGWRLFSPLLAIKGSAERGVSMGAHEGADRGSYYIAYEASGGDGCGDSGEEAGWARVHRVGPGGEAGFEDPSEVRFQAGNPRLGVRMEEYALHGLRFAVQPTFAILLDKGDLESTAAGGALLEAGYDLTRFVPFLNEVWLEAELGMLFGSETFIPIGLGVEGASYVGDRLSLIAGLGLAFTMASATSEVGGRDVSVSGSAFGAQLNAGVNYAIRPDWHARLMVEARSGFGSTRLKNDEELPGAEVDAGSLLMTMASLSISYTY